MPLHCILFAALDDAAKATSVLEWACEKMDERYEFLAEAGVRNIKGYNSLTQEELVAGLKSATLSGKIFPLVCTSGSYNVGSQPLLDVVACSADFLDHRAVGMVLVRQDDHARIRAKVQIPELMACGEARRGIENDA